MGSHHQTPLIGREHERALLLERLARVQAGRGQVIVLSGEAGIGKSRLVQFIRAHVAGLPHFRGECRCLATAQHSAFYPLIELFQRACQQQPDDTPAVKLRKLETMLAPYADPFPGLVPLVAALLSIPFEDRYPPLTLTPERQKQQTIATLLALIQALGTQHPVLMIVEDLHWADPSTLEFLDLLVAQASTTRLYLLLTCRPEFLLPWRDYAHLTRLTLTRLLPTEVAQLVTHVAGGKTLPPAVAQQLLVKSEGVPLFVEDITKAVLESDVLRATEDGYTLTRPLPPLAIPATLHEAILARLDRLGTAKVIAQAGAAWGRGFTEAQLRAVLPMARRQLESALTRLVDTEILREISLPPRLTYIFKHALVQEVAYASTPPHVQREYHQRIAHVLEEHVPETAATQPELLAHHYTQAGRNARAIEYWHRAGHHAIGRSAYVEAIQHLTTGLTLLPALPDGAERMQHELALSLTLGATLLKTKGYGAPEVEHTYARALTLCRQMGETPQTARVLFGLWAFYIVRARFHTASEVGEQLLGMAEHKHDPALFLLAHHVLGTTLLFMGRFIPARDHFERSIALDNSQQARSLFLPSVTVPRVANLFYLGLTLWYLGYPDQALRRSQDALTLAQHLAQPFSLAATRLFVAITHMLRREWSVAYEQAHAAVTLATVQEFAFWVSVGIILQGRILVAQGQSEAGITQMRQGIDANQATGAELARPFYFTLLAEAYGHTGQPTAGLRVLAEALPTVDASDERWWEAELYRLQGDLLLAQAADNHAAAETCWHHARTVARRQHAKAWELRAVVSLARLWHQQGKGVAARHMLAEVYDWFTEGWETADLREARALLDALT
jgi:predicted ATPase